MATRNQHQSALKKNIVPSVEGIVRHSKQTSLFLSVLCVQELQQQKIIYQLNLRENKTDVLDGARAGGVDCCGHSNTISIFRQKQMTVCFTTVLRYSHSRWAVVCGLSSSSSVSGPEHHSSPLYGCFFSRTHRRLLRITPSRGQTDRHIHIHASVIQFPLYCYN